MKELAAFVKTTAIGGLLVLFPLFGCAYLVIRIGGALLDFIKPLLSFLPQRTMVGTAIVDLASVVLLLLACFLTGLLVKTSVGRILHQALNRILNKIPGYRMLRRISSIVFDQESARGTPVVVDCGDSRPIGFLVEENSADEKTVFLPQAPTPFSGNILIVKANTVEKLNVSAAEVARVIATFGAGTRALLADRQTGDSGKRPFS